MVLHALLPGMLERGYGRIVCVSSISAILGHMWTAPSSQGHFSVF
jgi:NADP-dependent 3-hydroxy acid dehydrogenase YdfG